MALRPEPGRRAPRRGAATRARAQEPAGRPAYEEGSAVVEFVLVGVLLTGLFLGLVQLGIDLHIRNVLVASAAEGARYGANADRSPQDGVQRTRDLLRTALSDRYADGTITGGVGDAGGAAVVVVTVEAPLPWIFGWGQAASLSVRGHALQEQR